MPSHETPSPAPCDDSGPEAIRRNFAAVAAATDSPAPGDGLRLPTVNLSNPISVIARTVGMILHAAPLFRFGETLSTVDETGRIAGMTAERFTSWAENWLSFTRPAKDAPAVESIGKDLAGKIMAADQFRDHLRELKAVSEVRLPVWTGEGEARTVELAPEGFDPATGLFTVNRIPYQDDLTENEGSAILWDCLKEFPYDPEGETRVEKRRGFSAQMAAMIGVYCRELFPEGTPRPMIVYNANQSGSGKSLLMRVALAPSQGPPAESGKPETESEFEKVLDTAALARLPFLVLDDCRSIHSQALNRYVTSPVHACRLMHSQRMAMIPKVTQVFATGNGLTISADLDRRALVIDLFEPGDATARSFAKEITPGWLFSTDTRARILAALWALVRTWRDAGMPMMKEHRRASFEEWSGLIGGIVIACGMSNPFTPRLAETGGDERGRAVLRLLAIVAGEYPAGSEPMPTTQDLLDVADREGLTELLNLSEKDRRQSLGRLLRKSYLGRKFTDTQGRVFEFGRRKMADGARYPITFL